MRWLSIELGEQDDGKAIRLPCPAIDLVRLASLGSSENPQRSIHRLLRLNPSLLLFALSGYRQTLGRAPASANDLAAWSIPNLFRNLERLGDQPDSTSLELASENELRQSFKEFLRARSNKKLRRSLNRFLRSVCCLKKSTIKSVVEPLVGMNLRADDFKCKRVRRKTTYVQTSNQWLGKNKLLSKSQSLSKNKSLIETEHDIVVAGLLAMAHASFETASQFAARLTEEKLASMKQLAYGASHEINNPLANIATRAQTMLTKETDPEKRHKLTVIYEQAMRAHEMISDMMLFAHPPALRLESVSVRLLISRIVHELKPVFESLPAIQLKFLIGSAVDRTNLDPTQTSVALKNLIQNSVEALDSMDERNQQIEIRVDRTEAGELQFSVWDNGAGITDEVARHLFDPFYSGREAGRGLGFGLSKVWTIAKLHGGSLRHDPDVDHGTRFVLALPEDGKKRPQSDASEFSICINRPDAEEEAA